nr:cupin domain-containing protein [uncultured Lichenicoccus sp.]
MVNVDEIEEEAVTAPDGWISFFKPLTPALPRMGHLGMNLSRVPPGQSACPFHTHQIEDEVFFVISGRGLFRYGDRVVEIRAGDTVSCPAGTGIGHQIANPFDADLVYLAIGMNDPNEVATYPDSGQIMVRGLKQRGFLAAADYFEGQPAPCPILTMPVEAR